MCFMEAHLPPWWGVENWFYSETNMDENWEWGALICILNLQVILFLLGLSVKPEKMLAIFFCFGGFHNP